MSFTFFRPALRGLKESECRVSSGGLTLSFSQLGPSSVLFWVGDREHAVELDCDAKEVASGCVERLPPRG